MRTSKKNIQVTQTRSVIGQMKRHRLTLRALGLGRIGRSVTHTDSPAVRGMLRSVSHLITAEEVSK